ncbi:hypothetical protein ACFXA0_31430 [Streptomyces cyaneofuscatus]|uniref:hypothetical protein n=1 Tax=Streptomyces TaxID=1883 RepID=UPI001371A203|nr:hypothetical protein [Streptomyces sp. SID2119]MYW29134.1 hypothetical protein [Streptomyces sp. SID2119]
MSLAMWERQVRTLMPIFRPPAAMTAPGVRQSPPLVVRVREDQAPLGEAGRLGEIRPGQAAFP